ncbi:WD40-repeat-containing domain protein, partial [Dichotomopilus funicola]
HRREVCFVKFSHDGSRLVAGGDFYCVVIWDLAFQMALFKLKGHKQAVSCAAWSPDDSMVVTTSLDRTAKLWDADVSRSKPGGLS